ncbi:hypothetical protein SAMD00019534_027090, partial [Acytostelium subglobosum LB1]|uniref:hypothetical protein n=1 Tax=Acytostelium subglobosum LB1 TaxID=1410327 RepID=UPI000644B9E6
MDDPIASTSSTSTSTSASKQQQQYQYHNPKNSSSSSNSSSGYNNNNNNNNNNSNNNNVNNPPGYAGWGARSVDIFEKIEQIGEGTFGAVYKAKNKMTDEIVALKRVLMENESEGFPITAIREIKILKELNHMNVVKLKEIAVSKASQANQGKGSVYMVFEFMDHDLNGLMDSPAFKCFKPDQIKCYLKQLLEGLEYCHRNNILHRDIKGSNLLLNNEGILKLAATITLRPRRWTCWTDCCVWIQSREYRPRRHLTAHTSGPSHCHVIQVSRYQCSWLDLMLNPILTRTSLPKYPSCHEYNTKKKRQMMHQQQQQQQQGHGSNPNDPNKKQRVDNYHSQAPPPNYQYGSKPMPQSGPPRGPPQSTMPNPSHSGGGGSGMPRQSYPSAHHQPSQTHSRSSYLPQQQPMHPGAGGHHQPPPQGQPPYRSHGQQPSGGYSGSGSGSGKPPGSGSSGSSGDRR